MAPPRLVSLALITALVEACNRRDFSVVRLLLQEVPRDFLKERDGRVILRTAIESRSYSITLLLLQYCPGSALPSVEAGSTEEDILCVACRIGDLKIVDLLLSFGAKLSREHLNAVIATETNGALRREQEVVILALLQRGVSPSEEPWFSCPLAQITRLKCSASFYLSIIKFSSLSYVPSLYTEKSAYWLLIEAIRFGNLTAVQMLISTGTNPTVFEYENMAAAMGGSTPATVKLLLSQNLNPAVAGEDGRLAASHCVSHYFSELFDSLLAKEDLPLLIQTRHPRISDNMSLITYFLCLEHPSWENLIATHFDGRGDLLKEVLLRDILAIRELLALPAETPDRWVIFALGSRVALSALLQQDSPLIPAFAEIRSARVSLLEFLLDHRRPPIAFALPDGNHTDICLFMKEQLNTSLHTLTVKEMALLDFAFTELHGSLREAWVRSLFVALPSSQDGISLVQRQNLLTKSIFQADMEGTALLLRLGVDPNFAIGGKSLIHHCIRMRQTFDRSTIMTTKINSCIRLLLSGNEST